MVWSNVIPIKVSCFIWRDVQDRIPTAMALEKRGIMVNSLLCSACIGSHECTDHVLMECPFATVIRNNILSWCGVPCDLPPFNNVGVFLRLAATWCNSQMKKERFIVICYCLLWNLWRFRNKRLFHTEVTSSLHGSESIKLMAFY